MNTKARLRVVNDSNETPVSVITDPGLNMFMFYTTGETISKFKKGDKAIDGRTIDSVSDKGVILRDGNEVAFLDYRDVVNLKVPETLDHKIEEPVASHGKGSGTHHKASAK